MNIAQLLIIRRVGSKPMQWGHQNPLNEGQTKEWPNEKGQSTMSKILRRKLD
jgi:hypothetical protein